MPRSQLQSQLKEQEVKLEEGRRELEAMRAKLEQAQSNAGQAGVEEMEMLFQKYAEDVLLPAS